MDLNARVQVHVTGSLSDSSQLADRIAQISQLWTNATTHGVGANQADKIYTEKETSIASAGTKSLDVIAALTDPFGATFSPARLRCVAIQSVSTNTTNLTLFGDAASVPILNTAATTVTLTPGGLFLLTNMATAGIAVTTTTADIIKIVNAAGAAALVNIVLIGASS